MKSEWSTKTFLSSDFFKPRPLPSQLAVSLKFEHSPVSSSGCGGPHLSVIVCIVVQAELLVYAEVL